MLLMYFRFACSRDIFRCNQLLYGTGPFWKYSKSLSKELDLLLILNNVEIPTKRFIDLFPEVNIGHHVESVLFMLLLHKQFEFHLKVRYTA